MRESLVLSSYGVGRENVVLYMFEVVRRIVFAHILMFSVEIKANNHERYLPRMSLG